MFDYSHTMIVDKDVDPNINVTEYSTTIKVNLHIDSAIEREIPDVVIAEHIHETLLNYVKQCSEYDIRTGMRFIDKEETK